MVKLDREAELNPLWNQEAIVLNGSKERALVSGFRCG